MNRRKRWLTVVGEHASPAPAPEVPAPEVRGRFNEVRTTEVAEHSLEELALVAWRLGLPVNAEVLAALRQAGRDANRVRPPGGAEVWAEDRGGLADSDERPMSNPSRPGPHAKQRAEIWSWERVDPVKSLGRHPKDRKDQR